MTLHPIEIHFLNFSPLLAPSGPNPRPSKTTCAIQANRTIYVEHQTNTPTPARKCLCKKKSPIPSSFRKKPRAQIPPYFSQVNYFLVYFLLSTFNSLAELAHHPQFARLLRERSNALFPLLRILQMLQVLLQIRFFELR